MLYVCATAPPRQGPALYAPHCSRAPHWLAVSAIVTVSPLRCKEMRFVAVCSFLLCASRRALEPRACGPIDDPRTVCVWGLSTASQDAGARVACEAAFLDGAWESGFQSSIDNRLTRDQHGRAPDDVEASAACSDTHTVRDPPPPSPCQSEAGVGACPGRPFAFSRGPVPQRRVISYHPIRVWLCFSRGASRRPLWCTRANGGVQFRRGCHTKPLW